MVIFVSDFDADTEYQLRLKRNKLCRLYIAWERSLVGVPAAEGLPEWGPSQTEIIQYRVRHVLGEGVEIVEEGGYDYDVEFEADADGLLVEHLDSLRVSENYRDFQSSTL